MERDAQRICKLFRFLMDWRTSPLKQAGLPQRPGDDQAAAQHAPPRALRGHLAHRRGQAPAVPRRPHRHPRAGGPPGGLRPRGGRGGVRREHRAGRPQPGPGHLLDRLRGAVQVHAVVGPAPGHQVPVEDVPGHLPSVTRSAIRTAWCRGRPTASTGSRTACARKYTRGGEV